MKRRFGWRLDPEDGRDLDEQDALYGLGGEDPPRADLGIHEPRIWDQGRSSSCVAQAVVAGLMICESQAGLPAVDLARRFPYYAGRRRVTPMPLPVLDLGSFPREVVKALAKLGCPPEHLMPWSGLRMALRPSFAAYQGAHARRGGAYFRIAAKGPERGLAVRRCLGAGLPVTLGLEVPETFQANLGPEVIDLPRASERIVGRHLVLLTGHEEDLDHGHLYRVRNSWGRIWRADGRAWMTERFLQSALTDDLWVIVGWEAIRQRYDRDPKLAHWRAVTSNLETALATSIA